MSAKIVIDGGVLSNRKLSLAFKLLSLCVVCAAIYLAVLQIFSSNKTTVFNAARDGQTTPKIVSPVQAGANSPQAAPTPQDLAGQTGSYVRRTYQPGKQHPTRQLSAKVDPQNKLSAWWIHPKTEDEARWMDIYGYPTAADEGQLRVASLEELKALMDSGDMNAKAHWVGKSLVSDFEKGDFKARNPFTGRLESLLDEAGPYQATTFMQYYSQLLSAYRALPESERNGRNSQYVQDLGPLFKSAEARLRMVGDDIGLTISADVNKQAGMYFQGSMEYSLDGLAAGLAAGAKRRAERGEPPFAISTRPKQPPGDSSFYLERY